MLFSARAKRSILFAILFVCVLAIQSAPARAQFGVGVGLNFESISDVDAGDARATFDNATGYHVGVFYDLSLGPAAVRPGLYLRRVSGIDVSAGPLGALTQDDFNLTLIEVPVDLRYRLTLPAVKPYLLLGPVFGFASTNNDRLKDALEDLTISGTVGVGVELSLPGFTPTLYPEIRYSFGLSRFIKEEWMFGDTTITAEDSQRLSAIMLRLGLTF